MDSVETRSAANIQKAVKHTLDEKMADRISLLPIIEQILSGKFQSPISAEVLTSDIAHSEAEQIWRELKAEKNALAAIFIEEIWAEFQLDKAELLHGNTIDKGIQADLKDSRTSLEKWTSKAAHYLNAVIKRILKGQSHTVTGTTKNQKILRYTSLVVQDHLNQAIARWQNQHKEKLIGNSAPFDHLDRAYRRYCLITQFGYKHGFTLSGDETYDFEQGMVTARTTVYGLFELIPQVMQRKGIPLTPQTIKTLVLNSYGPFVHRFASLHNYLAIPLLNALKTGSPTHSFNPDYFDIVTQDESLKLTVDHTVLAKATDRNDQNILNKSINSDSTWCPASYAQGETKDVIREYFELCLQLAEKYYFQSISATQQL